MKTLLVALALVTSVGLSGCYMRTQPFDPEKLTAETFLFSDFTEHRFRTKEYGSTLEESPVLRSMRDTLLRLYPAGTDIQTFFAFFDRVVQREFKNSHSVEDQSRYRSNNGGPNLKGGCGIFPSGESAICDYRYGLNFSVVSLDAAAWLLSTYEGVYNIRITLRDGTISDLSITVAYGVS
jgi:hypothetical protein